MSPRGGRVLTRVLAGVSALAIVIGLLAVYVEQTVFDSRAFANRAVSMLDDEAVQTEIANAITDAAIESGPERGRGAAADRVGRPRGWSARRRCRACSPRA